MAGGGAGCGMGCTPTCRLGGPSGVPVTPFRNPVGCLRDTPKRPCRAGPKLSVLTCDPCFTFFLQERASLTLRLLFFSLWRMDEILIPAPTWGPAPFLPAADSDWGLGSSRVRLPGSPAWGNLWLGLPRPSRWGYNAPPCGIAPGVGDARLTVRDVLCSPQEAEVRAPSSAASSQAWSQNLGSGSHGQALSAAQGK